MHRAFCGFDVQSLDKRKNSYKPRTKRAYRIVGIVFAFLRTMKFFTIFIFIVAVSTQGFAQTHRAQRIAIVGGGPAGLAAAYRLSKAGFTNVTVLERAPEVGGMTETIKYQGHNYEMGAIMSGPSYHEVNSLAQEMGEKIVPFSPGASEVVVADPLETELKTMTISRKMKFLAAAVEYHVLYAKYRRYFDEPGMSQVPPELNEPFASWITKKVHFHSELQELLSHSFVSFGYGYMSEIPAAYVLRYFSPRLLRSFMFGQVHMLQSGYQTLWKKIADRLTVLTGFEIESARRESGLWVIKSKTGQRQEFDSVIWTAPLESAALVMDLPPPLKSIFSEIKYQFYNSSLVEVEGLAHGSGVVTKNYDVKQEGRVVSWLFRWPNKTNVANFYTLSDDFMTPLEVEKGLETFASTHGFKIKKLIKSAGWKYFPHFQRAELDARAYDMIESEQGKDGLFFGGQIMNFSTVEHVTEYSHALVDRFFISEGALSAKLPANYGNMEAKQKLDVLWKKIIASEYATRPSYAEVGGSLSKELGGFLPSQLKKAFNNTTDVLAEGRLKMIHKLGSTALLAFQPHDPGYNPFQALIRISNAVDGSTGKMYPSFSIKIPVSGAGPSINFIVGKSFDSQHIGDDWKAPTDFNFFRDDPKYPFSNELPLEPHTGFGKAFKWVFDRAHLAPNYIPVAEMTKVMNKPAPRRFVFRAPPEIRTLMGSDKYMDEREVMSHIPVGSVLFQVFESTGLDDPGRYVGDLKMTTRFVASSFGDENLYFRHESKGVKNPLSEFSQALDPKPNAEAKPNATRPQKLVKSCSELF